MEKEATATATAAVRFGVRKGAKFLFACEALPRDALTTELQRYLVRADELALLRNAEIAITKRLNIIEVDRMIACCRQHPPQALVAPVQAESDRTAFQELAAYLKQRERAGVGSISPGVLVMLIPIEGRDDLLRCQIVNTTTTVGEIGAQVSTVFEPAKDQRPPDVLLVSRPTSPTQTPPVTETTGAKAEDSTANPEPESRVPSGPPPPPTDANVAPASSRADDALLVGDKEGPFDRLRHEHASFNAFYHRVLLEWSTKPSDIDPARMSRPHS